MTTEFAWRCNLCGDHLRVAAATPAAALRALTAWEGCPCTPRPQRRTQTPPAASGPKADQREVHSSGAAGSGAPTGADTPAPSSNGSASDVCPVAVRSGEAGGGWRHTVQAVALYVGVPCVWLTFLAALAARMT